MSSLSLCAELMIVEKREDGTFQKISVDEMFESDVFNPLTDPATVILQGCYGSCKSYIAQRFMLDWAFGKYFFFDLVFYLKCEELMCISEEMSLIELLSWSCSLTSDQISQMLQDEPNKLLFIIDGFDELRLTQDLFNMSTHIDPLQKATPEVIVCSLMRRYIIPESFMLVTSRTKDTVGKLLKGRQRFTEIMGFSERGVDMYFQNLLSMKAYSCVRSNQALYTACSIPVICWIFSERFKVHEGITSDLKTTTSIYVDFVSTLLGHHCQGLSESIPTLLKSLGQLAERGMLEQQVLFDQKSVNEAVSDPAGSPFLGKFLFKKRTRQETMFSFMHLSFQEFFTALYYVLLDQGEFLSKLTERFHNHWQNYGVQYLDKNCPLKYGCPELHFLPVVQFLCGLCNKEVSNSLKETHNVSAQPFVQEQLKEWILHISSNRDYNFLPFILHCLYELHEKDFAQKAVEAWQVMDMSWDALSRNDCWALVYCLECCPHFRSLNLNFAAEELKMLQHVLCRTPILELTVQNLSDTDVSDLISALGVGKRLRELQLNSNGLSDQSVQQILHALRKQKTVGGLQIAVKNISAETTLILTDFLHSTEKWEEISVRTTAACNDVESLCSSLQLNNFNGNLVLNVVRWCSSPQNAPSLSEMILKFPCSKMSNINLKNILQEFHNINCLTEQSAGFDEQVDALLSHLSSVSGLSAINLSAPLLTEKWASKIVFLIQSCSSLAGLSFNAGSWSCNGAKWLPGLLMEEGIRLLKESPKHPQCTLNIKGFRCSKSTDCCTYQTEQIRELDCNQRATIRISGEDCTEEISPQINMFISPDEN